MYYKLTNQDMQTYNGCQWTLGEWKETSGRNELCSNGWLHCYSHPLLAVLLNPIHADIDNPRLFEIETDGKMLDNRGLKQGFTRMRLVREIPLPVISSTQRAAFGILCVKQVCKDVNWNKWADNWLDGIDRSAAADYAAYAAIYAVYAAADAADGNLNLIAIAEQAMKY